MRKILLVCTASLVTLVATTATVHTKDLVTEFENAAKNLPRGTLGIPNQWFEMKSTVGWERMMLVLGYADNRTTCEQLVVMAKEESPNRDFRCSPAN